MLGTLHQNPNARAVQRRDFQPRRTLRRPAFDHNDLEVTEGLVQNRLDGILDEFAVVEGGYDNAEKRLIIGPGSFIEFVGTWLMASNIRDLELGTRNERIGDGIDYLSGNR